MSLTIYIYIVSDINGEYIYIVSDINDEIWLKIVEDIVHQYIYIYTYIQRVKTNIYGELWLVKFLPQDSFWWFRGTICVLKTWKKQKEENFNYLHLK